MTHTEHPKPTRVPAGTRASLIGVAARVLTEIADDMAHGLIAPDHVDTTWVGEYVDCQRDSLDNEDEVAAVYATVLAALGATTAHD